jgi:hypothetical protein
MFDIHDFIERPTFSGSSQSTVSGLPVLHHKTTRTQVFQNHKVAVPSPQHSPILGQLPDAQIVFKLYLSTKLSVYFFPIGNFTFNRFWPVSIF